MVKSTEEVSQNFVAFLEYMNFNSFTMQNYLLLFFEFFTQLAEFLFVIDTVLVPL